MYLIVATAVLAVGASIVNIVHIYWISKQNKLAADLINKMINNQEQIKDFMSEYEKEWAEYSKFTPIE